MVHFTDPATGDLLRYCPICDGRMELVANRHTQQVCVCSDCLLSISIPAKAWDIARTKRELKAKKREYSSVL